MKKIMFILLSIATITTASAMPARGIGGGFHGGFHAAPRTTVILNNGFYNPFGFYYGFPYYTYGIPPTPPSKLDLQVQSIKVDYADKIKSVKMDDSLTSKEKKDKVRAFKTEREHAIIQAKRDFYKS
ncbi:MAG: hypothetical protein QM731_25990 [Chitinophagaceae bacterium]